MEGLEYIAFSESNGMGATLPALAGARNAPLEVADALAYDFNRS
jgi:hypothetical protein